MPFSLYVVRNWTSFVYRYVTLDTACNSKTASGNAVRLYIEHDVDVFIGPPCSVGESMMTSSNGNIFGVTGHSCGEFTGDRWISRTKPVTRSFDVFFYLRLNERLSKQSWGWWFGMPSRPFWRHSNALSAWNRAIYEQCIRKEDLFCVSHQSFPINNTMIKLSTILCLRQNGHQFAKLFLPCMFIH